MIDFLQDYSNEKKFKFTILIPLYNRLNYFEKCIESILEQTHISPTEILCLDNASDEINRQAIEAVLEKYGHYINSSFYSFHYFRNPEQLGEYANINYGLHLANGDWIQVLSEADRLLPEAFSKVERIIENNPNLDLISCRFYEINDQDEIIKKSPQLAPKGLVDQRFLDLFLSDNPLDCVAVLYNKNIFTKIGYFNLNLQAAADWEFLRRASKIPNVQWYSVPHHLVCHRLLELNFAQLNPAGEFVWQMLELGKQYYSEMEQKNSKKSQYLRLFSSANQLLETKQIAKVCSIMLDLVKFSDLGDRLWLEVLNQSDFKHKKELYNFVVQFSQKSYLG